MQINNKKIINAWCFYDWANSAYSLVITSTIFPIYYLVATRAQFKGDIVSFFGFSITNSVLFSYSISVSYLIIAFISPLLSGIADYGGKKRRFMQLFVTIGSLACISLFWFNGKNVELGVIAFGIATLGYSGSIVFYNAFLPEIVTEDLYDKISARGFSFGYVGSVLLLIVNLITIQFHEEIGISEDFATRLAFLMVGFWWIGFSMITFYYIKDKHRNKIGISPEILVKGFNEIGKVFRYVVTQKNILLFLSSFFFYSMGVQTIMFLAATFAEKELKMEGAELILIVLILQLVAIAGAYLFAKISGKLGNKVALMILLLIWVVICFVAYIINTKLEFYLVAAVIGSIMGGIQSMSRSTYSKLIPEGTKDNASFFSFYDFLEKIAIVIGTFSYGYIEMLTGSMRNSILVLGTFFVIGVIFMSLTRIVRNKKTEEVIPLEI